MIFTGNVLKSLTIYNIAEFFGMAYSKAFVPNYIMKGFTVTEFVPFSKKLVSDDQFLAFIGTNRPMLHETDFVEPTTNKATQTDNISLQHSNSNLSPFINTLETVSFYSKVQTSKMLNGGRRKTKSRSSVILLKIENVQVIENVPMT